MHRPRICQIVARFLAPLAHCAFGFTYKDGAYRRNLHWRTETEARAYCSEHGYPYNGERSPDEIRWMTPLLFNTEQELVQYVCVRKPHAIHVGVQFMDGGAGGRDFELRNDLIQWPLRFDLDIHLQQRASLGVCQCGAQRQCCNACWAHWVMPRLRSLLFFFTITMRYRRLLLVYSGRRGVHLWILDAAAQNLTISQRIRICEHVKQQLGIELDKDVTIKPSHLCKVPIYPHAETGRLAMPIALDAVEDFRPEAVPTLETVTVEQLDWCEEIVNRVKNDE